MKRAWAWLRWLLFDEVRVPEAGDVIYTSCVACDGQTLFRRPGGAWIECWCGAQYSVAEYLQAARAEDERDRSVW